MEITNEIKEKIKQDVLKDKTKERCGIILRDGTVIPCENRATDSDRHFIIARGDLKKAQRRGWIEAVYHSHVPGDYIDDDLSHEDKVIAERFNIQSIMYSIKNNKFHEYQPTGKPVEYVGRPYIRGILDEIHLIRDYYEKELNIKIEDTKNKNIEHFLSTNGFMEVSYPQKHDILIVNWAGDKDNKKMVIYNGNNKLIVHPEFELSKEVDYNYGLQKWTEKIYRHHRI